MQYQDQYQEEYEFQVSQKQSNDDEVDFSDSGPDPKQDAFHIVCQRWLQDDDDEDLARMFGSIVGAATVGKLGGSVLPNVLISLLTMDKVKKQIYSVLSRIQPFEEDDNPMLTQLVRRIFSFHQDQPDLLQTPLSWGNEDLSNTNLSKQERIAFAVYSLQNDMSCLAEEIKLRIESQDVDSLIDKIEVALPTLQRIAVHQLMNVIPSFSMTAYDINMLLPSPRESYNSISDKVVELFAQMEQDIANHFDDHKLFYTKPLFDAIGFGTYMKESNGYIDRALLQVTDKSQKVDFDQIGSRIVEQLPTVRTQASTYKLQHMEDVLHRFPSQVAFKVLQPEITQLLHDVHVNDVSDLCVKLTYVHHQYDKPRQLHKLNQFSYNVIVVYFGLLFLAKSLQLSSEGDMKTDGKCLDSAQLKHYAHASTK